MIFVAVKAIRVLDHIEFVKTASTHDSPAVGYISLKVHASRPTAPLADFLFSLLSLDILRVVAHEFDREQDPPDYEQN